MIVQYFKLWDEINANFKTPYLTIKQNPSLMFAIQQHDNVLPKISQNFFDKSFQFTRNCILSTKNGNSDLFKSFNNDTHYGISTEFCNKWLLNYDDLESLIIITTKKLNTSSQLEYYPLRQSNLKSLGDISAKKLKFLKSEERKSVNRKQTKKSTKYSKFKRFYF